uniref:Uncharacterized protein n=1 Tax=Nymphaea colorata TaxID=210225 RepID=A0A5K1EL71_9MAGN
MSNEGRLFHFMNGLQSWAEQELHRQDPEDLGSALAVTERLIDINKQHKLEISPLMVQRKVGTLATMVAIIVEGLGSKIEELIV